MGMTRKLENAAAKEGGVERRDTDFSTKVTIAGVSWTTFNSYTAAKLEFFPSFT